MANKLDITQIVTLEGQTNKIKSLLKFKIYVCFSTIFFIKLNYILLHDKINEINTIQQRKPQSTRNNFNKIIFSVQYHF